MLYGSEETLIGKPSMSLGSSEASIVQKSLQVWYKNQCDKQNERHNYDKVIIEKVSLLMYFNMNYARGKI